MVDAHVFHEGETSGGHGYLFWQTSFPSYGPLQGEVCVAPSRRMQRVSGDTEVIPGIRSVW